MAVQVAQRLVAAAIIEPALLAFTYAAFPAWAASSRARAASAGSPVGADVVRYDREERMM